MKAAVCALAVLALAAPARAEPANTLKELFAQLGRCLAPVALPVGTDVTVRFELNRRGGVIGKPTLTHALWPRNADPKQAAAAVAAGFDACLPVSITDALGGAVAGRPIAYRLRAAPAETRS